MGASNSKVEEDKALQLCRERKKFVRKALDGRCSLAAAHVTYIQSLKNTGTALRKFLELQAPVESSLYTSTSATPEPQTFTDKSPHFSYPSPTLSQQVDAVEAGPPSPAPANMNHVHVHHMKFGFSFSKKVEEKHSAPVVGRVTAFSTDQSTTPHPAERSTTPDEDPPLSPQTPPWDYFGLTHPIDHQFTNQGLENQDVRGLREDGGIVDYEEDEEKDLSHSSEESQDSEDEFEETGTETLIRSFENRNRVQDQGAPDASPPTPSKETVGSETNNMDGEKSTSPYASPLVNSSSAVILPTKDIGPTTGEGCSENRVASKDIFSSIKDIEYLFIRASESGKEVPRMLEANKLHFRPIFPGKERRSMSYIFKDCFSCGEDPSPVQEEPAQTDVKYLTWHRTVSSRSSSSRNLLGLNPKDDPEEFTGNIFDNTCMFSGSHASTLDRLFAWERKLYDEVKATDMLRRDYDRHRKNLRQIEAKGLNSGKLYKTRAVVKDLHCRIRIAIERIESISKRIEELRDKELQPQLEELIEGLRRMWEVMSECHKLQFHIISVSYNNGNTKITIKSESHRQVTIHLENELSFLSSSFTKWIGAQKSYLESIDGWLCKCYRQEEKMSRRKKRPQPPRWRMYGPPIYVTCGLWLESLESLPTKEVANSIKALAADATLFVPQEGKNQEKNAKHPSSMSWKADDNELRDEALEEWIPGSDHFRSNLVDFLGNLSKFADSSLEMYEKLQKAIQESKINYGQR